MLYLLIKDFFPLFASHKLIPVHYGYIIKVLYNNVYIVPFIVKWKKL